MPTSGPPPAGATAGRAAVRHGWVAAAVGIAISILFLYWSLRGVDLHAVWGHTRSAKPLPLILSIILATLAFPLRVVRWRILLRQADGARIPVVPAWHAVAMGFMANNLFPFRAGEFLRSFALHRLTNVRFTSSLASVAVERVFDGLAVVAMLFVALRTANLPAGVTIGETPVTELAGRAGILSLAALVGAVLVVAFPLVAERIIRRIVPFRKLADRLVSLIEGVRLGFAALSSPGRVLAVAFWSVVVWFTIGLSFWIAFSAFDIPVGIPGGILVMSVLLFAITIPSTPGYVGLFEASVIVALGLYGVDRDQAFAYAAVYHVTTFLPITLLGLWSMARTHIGLKDLRKADV